jgi:protein-S-isoprenylcysteine O-methyltransferase Ste14
MLTVPDLIAKVTFDVVLASWFGFALIFVLRKKPPKAAESKRDRISKWGIALQSVGYFFVFYIHRPEYTPIFPMPRAAEFAVAVLTVGLAIASVGLCVWAVQTLGKQWTYAARLVEGHELIMRGPYGIVRNPIYLAMLGMMIATGLASAKWQAMLVGIVMFLVGNQVRIRSEEKLLREAFGTQFDEYAHRVPALFPRIF